MTFFLAFTLIHRIILHNFIFHNHFFVYLIFFFFALHYQVPEKREKAKVITLFQGICITHKGVIYADG